MTDLRGMRRTYRIEPFGAQLAVAIGEPTDTLTAIARRAGLPSPEDATSAAIVYEAHQRFRPRWVVLLKDAPSREKMTNVIAHEAVHLAWLIICDMDSEFDLGERELHEQLAYHTGQIAELIEKTVRAYRRNKRLLL